MDKWLQGLFVSSILIFVAACSGGSSTPTTTSITTTTLSPASAQEELDKLAKQSTAVDYSMISDSQCGKSAIVIVPQDIHFYRWTSIGWQQDDSNFGDWIPKYPVSVTTNDYTNDGLDEFLLTIDIIGVGGAILAQFGCKWQWLQFQGAECFEEGRILEEANWSEDEKQLSGIESDCDGERFSVPFVWFPEERTFKSRYALKRGLG
jgi:hypothetical protein